MIQDKNFDLPSDYKSKDLIQKESNNNQMMTNKLEMKRKSKVSKLKENNELDKMNEKITNQSISKYNNSVNPIITKPGRINQIEPQVESNQMEKNSNNMKESLKISSQNNEKIMSFSDNSKIFKDIQKNSNGEIIHITTLKKGLKSPTLIERKTQHNSLYKTTEVSKAIDKSKLDRIAPIAKKLASAAEIENNISQLDNTINSKEIKDLINISPQIKIVDISEVISNNQIKMFNKFLTIPKHFYNRERRFYMLKYHLISKFPEKKLFDLLVLYMLNYCKNNKTEILYPNTNSLPIFEKLFVDLEIKKREVDLFYLEKDKTKCGNIIDKNDISTQTLVEQSSFKNLTTNRVIKFEIVSSIKDKAIVNTELSINITPDINHAETNLPNDFHSGRSLSQSHSTRTPIFALIKNDNVSNISKTEKKSNKEVSTQNKKKSNTNLKSEKYNTYTENNSVINQNLSKDFNVYTDDEFIGNTCDDYSENEIDIDNISQAGMMYPYEYSPSKSNYFKKEIDNSNGYKNYRNQKYFNQQSYGNPIMSNPLIYTNPMINNHKMFYYNPAMYYPSNFINIGPTPTPSSTPGKFQTKLKINLNELSNERMKSDSSNLKEKYNLLNIKRMRDEDKNKTGETKKNLEPEQIKSIERKKNDKKNDKKNEKYKNLNTNVTRVTSTENILNEMDKNNQNLKNNSSNMEIEIPKINIIQNKNVNDNDHGSPSASDFFNFDDSKDLFKEIYNEYNSSDIKTPSFNYENREDYLSSVSIDNIYEYNNEMLNEDEISNTNKIEFDKLKNHSINTSSKFTDDNYSSVSHSNKNFTQESNKPFTTSSYPYHIFNEKKVKKIDIELNKRSVDFNFDSDLKDNSNSDTIMINNQGSHLKNNDESCKKKNDNDIETIWNILTMHNKNLNEFDKLKELVPHKSFDELYEFFILNNKSISKTKEPKKVFLCQKGNELYYLKYIPPDSWQVVKIYKK